MCTTTVQHCSRSLTKQEGGTTVTDIQALVARIDSGEMFLCSAAHMRVSKPFQHFTRLFRCAPVLVRLSPRESAEGRRSQCCPSLPLRG